MKPQVPNRLPIGEVKPKYGPLRRSLLPIYGLDQLVVFATIVIPFAVWAFFDPKLALYVGVGAYLGASLTMQLSTPSALLLPANCETRVVDLLDSSSFLKRTGSSQEWMSTRGRLRRWDSDTIHLKRTPDGLLITGRLMDLHQIASQIQH